MLVLWLATGVLGKTADSPAEGNISTGWVEYSRTNRTRADWKKEREEIREAVKSALKADGHEAKELVAAVEPFVEQRAGRVEFDWSGIRADLQSVMDAVRDYREAMDREAAEEAEEIEFLMMVA